MWKPPKPSKRPPMPEIMTFKPPKKHIATVVEETFHATEFDKIINDFVDAGYILTKRERIILKYNDKDRLILYAELEKIVID